ncbi:ABC transporter permease [Chengkuizengella marina]|uniref:ABC transporter permease n=1 Tax=Chengkuizengella marina TaxID=2507566 RepID=UPI001370BACD|nr:ABC-2 family transporter protein [Chengkuizengella marina]
MKRIKGELIFLLSVWKLNLSSAMEYRASFLIQVFMMVINNAIYFVFWLLFFDQFEQVGGWALHDMFLLFAIVTTGFGIAFMLFGNGTRLSSSIEEGQMDYYLALPRNVQLYALASRSSVGAIGDIMFGVSMFILAGHYTIQAILLWMLCSLFVASIIVSYVSILSSTAFWIGRASILTEQGTNALLTFSMYPTKIFEGLGYFLIFTIIPAGFISVVPVEIISEINVSKLVMLGFVTIILLVISIIMFNRGLRKYESGNMLNINL